MREHFTTPSGEKVTWGDLKQFIEENGITDSDEIDSIDISWGKPEKLRANFDDDFGWQVFTTEGN